MTIIVIIPPMDGISVRLTISNGGHSPALLTATITPDTGEIARPIPATSCIGRSNVTAPTPNFVAMAGARLENEKNAATPEPVITAVIATINVMTTDMASTPNQVVYRS